jgi:hypothetical protein
VIRISAIGSRERESKKPVGGIGMSKRFSLLLSLCFLIFLVAGCYNAEQFKKNVDRERLPKFAEGATHAEIGKIMGKSESAVKSIYYRTLKALRKAFKEREFIK